MSSANFDDDSDCELGLLSPDDDVQIFGEHELKMAPLVTKDVANLSNSFVQRGLLGKVLSVHADDIPLKTKDPRIYMNLNAPSSGLVCGVQVCPYTSGSSRRPLISNLGLWKKSHGLMHYGGLVDDGQEGWNSTFSSRHHCVRSADCRLSIYSCPFGYSFHFDEENGGRPCEAAFLSEFKDGSTRAVNEVVVLVSSVSCLCVLDLLN
jgi:hypothetical protein